MGTGGYLGSRYGIDLDNQYEFIDKEIKPQPPSREYLDALNEAFREGIVDEKVLSRPAKPGEIPLSVLNTAYELKKLFDMVRAREEKSTTPDEGACHKKLMGALNDAYEIIRKQYPVINPFAQIHGTYGGGKFDK